jgi:hypothetical protein
MLWFNIVIAIVYLQFISPQSAFINIGLGGEGSAGFSGAEDIFVHQVRFRLLQD